MPSFGPISRVDLIRHLRQLDFEGPYSGGKHQYHEKGRCHRHATQSTPWRNRQGIVVKNTAASTRKQSGLGRALGTRKSESTPVGQPSMMANKPPQRMHAAWLDHIRFANLTLGLDWKDFRVHTEVEAETANTRLAIGDVTRGA